MHPVQQFYSLAPLPPGGAPLRPGMLVRARVLKAPQGMVLEYSGGKLPLASTEVRESGWKLWRIESRQEGLAVRELAQGQVARPSVARGLTRLLTLLFADKNTRRQVLTAIDNQTSTGEAILRGLFPDSLAKVRQLFEQVRTSKKSEPIGKILAEFVKKGMKHADLNSQLPESELAGSLERAALLVCSHFFPAADEVPLLVIAQAGMAESAHWLFAGLELSQTGPVNIAIRLQDGQILADVWCPQDVLEIVRDELEDRFLWPVRLHPSKTNDDILDWPFAWLADAGGFDARA